MLEAVKWTLNLFELFCFLIKTFKTTIRFQPALKMQSAVGDRREVFCLAFKLTKLCEFSLLQINSSSVEQCWCFTLVGLAQAGGRSIDDLCSLLDVWHQEGQSLWLLIRSVRFYPRFSFVFLRPVWGKEMGYNMREYLLTRHRVSSASINREKYQR